MRCLILPKKPQDHPTCRNFSFRMYRSTGSLYLAKVYIFLGFLIFLITNKATIGIIKFIIIDGSIKDSKRINP